MTVAISTLVLLGASAAAHAQAGANSAGSGTTTAVALPDTQVWLGSVRLPARVKADGQPLAPGTYRVRLTGEHAKEGTNGQSAELERWVEFVQGNQVKGRVLAPVVPAADARSVADAGLPARGSVRAERLKGDDYYRVWFNYRGEQILIYLPLG